MYQEKKKMGVTFQNISTVLLINYIYFLYFFYKNMTNSFLVRIKLYLPIFILRDEINKGTRWRPPINHIAIYIYRNRAKMYKLCFFFLSMKIFAGVILLFDELYSFEQIRELINLKCSDGCINCRNNIEKNSLDIITIVFMLKNCRAGTRTFLTIMKNI